MRMCEPVRPVRLRNTRPRRMRLTSTMPAAGHSTIIFSMPRCISIVEQAQMPEPIGARWTLLSTSLTPSI